jgi:predicted ribosome quality control (RQC) complex YloA/Tae2 family protein
MEKLQESLADDLDQFFFQRIDRIPFTEELQKAQDKQIQLLNWLESHIKSFEHAERAQEILDMLIAYSNLSAGKAAMAKSIKLARFRHHLCYIPRYRQ